MESKFDQSLQSIPNKIHFIWIGGVLPDDYLIEMIKLAAVAKKSGFDFNVWVDNKENFSNALKNLRFKKYDLSQIEQKSYSKRDSEKKLRRNTLYIDANWDGLHYQVIGLDKQLKTGMISWDELEGLPHNTQEIINSPHKFLPKILEITSKAGHTDDSFVLDLEITASAAKTLGITLRKVSELIKGMIDDPFYQVKGGNRLRNFQYHTRREMIGLKNIAAAADLLRYEILRQEGGYYFDADTKFAIDKNSALRVDETALGIKANVRLARNEFRVEIGGNDIIAVVPHHVVMERVILSALKNYEKLDKQKELGLYGILGTTVEEYEDQLGFRISKDTTSMDAKRYPFGQGTRRYVETLQSAGPGAFNVAINHFLAKQKNNHHLDLTVAKSIELGFEPKIANIGVKSGQGKSWVAKAKPKTLKGSSFDDTHLSPFQLFSKKSQNPKENEMEKIKEKKEPKPK